MDRQLLTAGILVALMAAGCAKSSSENERRSASVQASQAQAGLATGGVATHRPVIVSPESAAAAAGSAPASSSPAQQPPGSPPQLVDAAPERPLWPAPSPDITPLAPGEAAPAADIAPFESPTERAFNPLRSSALAPPPTADSPNLLRTPTGFAPSAVPRIARSTAPAAGAASAPPPFPSFAPEAPAPDAPDPNAPAPEAPFPAAGLPPAEPPEAGAPADAPPPAGGSAGPAAEAPSGDDSAGSHADEIGAEAIAGGAATPSITAETGPGAPASTAPSRALADPAAGPSGPYDTVRVFYGTDRAEIAPLGAGAASAVVRFLPTGFALLVTLCLGLIAAAKRKSAALWTLVCVGAIVSTGLALQASSTTLTALRWQDKAGLRYGVDRNAGGAVHLGICEVTIPKIHKTGELESPSILRLEVRDDLARHVALTKTERLQTDAFYAQLRGRVAASSRKELFVFIHGFDVSFEDAARRTAQIHHDLKFPGAPVFFSWPANNKSLLTYPADENTITWSTPHLKQFLLDIVKHSDAQSINLVAHSMGNRALTVALREIELEFRDQARLFNSVVLAAPDIDAEDFRVNIAPRMQHTAKYFTLYASSRDDALRASQLLHRSPRAGDAGRGLVVVPGIDTIDVSAIDTSPWGHSYYGSSDPVLQDLGMIMAFGRPPQDRRWLSPADRDGLTYWIFEPSQTAGLSPVQPH